MNASFAGEVTAEGMDESASPILMVASIDPDWTASPIASCCNATPAGNSDGNRILGIAKTTLGRQNNNFYLQLLACCARPFLRPPKLLANQPA